jgi:hypothetical protein
MAEEPISYYPPDLPLEIANIVIGAHTLDVLRLGAKPRPRTIGRVHLTCGGEPTPHGKRPDATDEQLAEEIWSKAEADAQKNCKGHAKYKIVATYSKPARGTTEEPKSFEIEVGDAPLADERTQRDELLSESRQRERDKHREYLELCREVTGLAKAVGGMATGLATAWSSVHERESKSKEHALELAVLNADREGERERMRLLEKTVIPMLRVLQGKAPALALGEADKDKPEIVRVARRLGRSLSAEQLDEAAELLGSDRLRELAAIDDASEVLAFMGWLIGHEHVLDLYGKLREDQVPMVDRLQTLVAEIGEKHGEQKALAAG